MRTVRFGILCSANEDTVEFLLKAKGIDVNAKDENGNTPLHWAAVWGRKGAVEFLLKAKGIDVNAKDKNENTPLHWATINGHKDVAEVLLKAEGIDVNAKDKNENTPLYYACNAECYSKNIIEILLKKGAKVDATIPLHGAARNGDIEMVNVLLTKEADVNAKDENGKTPLHFAVEKRDKNVAEALIRETLRQGSSIQKPGYLTGAFSTYWDECKIEEKDSVNDESILIDPKDAQKNNWLTVAAPAALAITGVAAGIAIAVYLEMLAVGIAVGAICCLVAAAIIYYCDRPSSSLGNSNVQGSCEEVQGPPL